MTVKDTAFLDRYGPWVVIAGASEGTGEAFSRLAAAKGASCLLVARRAEKLEALAKELRAEHGATVEILSLDLSLDDAPAKLQAATADKDVGLLIFNAGGDTLGSAFLASDYEAWRSLLKRNIDTFTETCHQFGQRLVKRGRGGLILVGSEAGFGGVGRMALYTATKAYGLAFGESLWKELKPKGVDVLNLVIGATDTPTLRGVLEKVGLSADSLQLSLAADVVRKGFDNLANGPTLVLAPEADDANPLSSDRLRRDRVESQSKFLDNFFGPP